MQTLTPTTQLTSEKLEECRYIQHTIESMTKEQQLEFLRILIMHPESKSFLVEKQHTTSVNLCQLSPTLLQQLKTHINYITLREENLQKQQIAQDAEAKHLLVPSSST